jgi:hypothetical protein
MLECILNTFDGRFLAGFDCLNMGQSRALVTMVAYLGFTVKEERTLRVLG